jgi:hypothetical protein
MADHLLAHRDGLAFVYALMVGSGGICPDCGHGTRATSKRWAKCKACGKRVARRIVELAIGRRLRSGEVVHHKDGNRLNNHRDNLELMDRGAHSRLHRMADSHTRERDHSGRFV